MKKKISKTHLCITPTIAPGDFHSQKITFSYAKTRKNAENFEHIFVFGINFCISYYYRPPTLQT